MALTATQVRVAGTGEAHVGAVNTAEPTGPTAVLPPADWTGLGYTTEDGATISRSPNQENIMAWQSVTPVRIITTELELTVAAQFIQSNADILALYFGIVDGFVAGTDPDTYKGEIPADPAVIERALIMDWQDGFLDDGTTPLVTRLWLPRTTLSETGDTSLTRTAAVGWEMTFSALAPDDGPTGVILTNDPAFAPPAP